MMLLRWLAKGLKGAGNREKSKFLTEVGFLSSDNLEHLKLSHIELRTDLTPLRELIERVGEGIFSPSTTEIIKNNEFYPATGIPEEMLTFDVTDMKGQFYMTWMNEAMLEHARLPIDATKTEMEEFVERNIAGQYPSDWEKRKERVFRRDLYRCCLCGEKCHPGAVTAHHVKRLKAGGDSEFTNIVTLCEKCHDVMPSHEVRHKQYFTTGSTIHSVVCPNYEQGIHKIIDSKKADELYNECDHELCDECRPFETEKQFALKRFKIALEERYPVVKAHLVKQHEITEGLHIAMLAKMMVNGNLPQLSLFRLNDRQSTNKVRADSIEEVEPKGIWATRIDLEKLMDRDDTDAGFTRPMDPGTVINFETDEDKRFGFIQSNGRKYFFHETAVNARRVLKKGDKVLFDWEPSSEEDKLDRAYQVILESDFEERPLF